MGQKLGMGIIFVFSIKCQKLKFLVKKILVFWHNIYHQDLWDISANVIDFMDPLQPILSLILI